MVLEIFGKLTVHRGGCTHRRVQSQGGGRQEGTDGPLIASAIVVVSFDDG
jgi:hypothetical protein